MSGAELCERQFQSTPPARGRLEKILLRLKKTAISIHAPREGGRLPSEYPGSGANDISIHAPARGGATGEVELVAGVVLKFQSTPPRRGATRCSSDLRWVPQNFNPRPREGGRRCGIAGAVQGIAISIHAPARGGDRYDRAASLTAWYFNPRPREGGRLLWMSTRPTVLIFQSTPPRGGAT